MISTLRIYGPRSTTSLAGVFILLLLGRAFLDRHARLNEQHEHRNFHSCRHARVRVHLLMKILLAVYIYYDRVTRLGEVALRRGGRHRILLPYSCGMKPSFSRQLPQKAMSLFASSPFRA